MSPTLSPAVHVEEPVQQHHVYPDPPQRVPEEHLHQPRGLLLVCDEEGRQGNPAPVPDDVENIVDPEPGGPAPCRGLPDEGFLVDVHGHTFPAGEEASPLGLPEDLLQAGVEEGHRVFTIGLQNPVTDHAGAGGVPTPLLEERYGGLDVPLGHGGEEE